MNNIRKERVIVAIASMAGIACILQNYFGGWEFWVPPVIFVGGIAIWWVHLTEKLNPSARLILYYAYAAFLMFYHGIHESSLYDVSLVACLFIVTFSISDRKILLNLILIEYGAVMAIQFWLMSKSESFDFSAYSTMKLVCQIGVVFTMYVFNRIALNHRVTESERIKEWKDSVSKNNHDMEDFLSNISHELRTPINVIGGMTTLLRKNNDCDELTSIQEAGIRLAHQIEDIQDYTELKRGELVLEDDKYMCISLINDVVANYESIEKKNNLELIVDLDPNTPNMMRGDIQKLHKLFRHLLDNAVKFTKRGGIYVKVFSEQKEYGVNLTIEVTDTGIGMTRADLSRVSKGMYQADKKRNRNTGGIGIGLSIVYGFVHRMGGFVRINSVKGRGTTVHLAIPQSVVDPSPCLFIKEEASEGVVFYIKPEKYKVPEIREFYREMAVNLATGLKTRLYSASDCKELERLTKELSISHIFTGQEEYEADSAFLSQVSENGIKVIVSANAGFQPSAGSGVLVMKKPLYGFPVVRIINGEEDEFLSDNRGKVKFTGVSALVVDDEPMNLVVATGLLREYKMFADTAESGRDAIEKYRNGEYDVIFMDHMMPEMDGVEAMKRIRQIAEETGRTPVIVALTANALSGAKEMFIREGFDGFIAKPIDIAEFERVMKHVLPEELIRTEGRS